jgi:hypothetical protein
VNKSTSYLYVAGEFAKNVVNLMKDKISKDDEEDEVSNSKQKTKRSKKKSTK